MPLNPKDGTLALLMEFNIPVTRENYLDLAFAGKPSELDGETAEELAEIIGILLPDAPPHKN